MHCAHAAAAASTMDVVGFRVFFPGAPRAHKDKEYDNIQMFIAEGATTATCNLVVMPCSGILTVSLEVLVT